MKACLRAVLLTLCLALLLIVQALSLPTGWIDWDRTNQSHVPEAQRAETRIIAFDEVFVAVPEELWKDRDAPLPDDGFRELLERLRDAGLSPHDVRSERARLGIWLDECRANSALDLVGAWHGVRRLVNGEVDREYEVNRRKRKLLGEMLAAFD